jgi:hypothetical protein
MGLYSARILRGVLFSSETSPEVTVSPRNWMTDLTGQGNTLVVEGFTIVTVTDEESPRDLTL